MKTCGKMPDHHPDNNGDRPCGFDMGHCGPCEWQKHAATSDLAWDYWRSNRVRAMSRRAGHDQIGTSRSAPIPLDCNGLILSGKLGNHNHDG
ncbi:MAG: hypothetical protein COA96_16790 [SAR86 cluster bacterium]|uniref:Uncharacterized protein n=1 Tax=SAR86 cluster bacterium TaxID=2030880 RepID=A0A2A5AG18_9GAMM|nr:MAG: hypothetical protein COA96_16790 [SAR86 cluster bacterium]